jgi:hypothetical protein
MVEWISVFRDHTTHESIIINVVYGILSLLFFVVLIVLVPLAVRVIVRRLAGSKHLQAGTHLLCARCGSNTVEQLPSNGITPNPGYDCRQCQLHMRRLRSGLFYWAVLVLAVGIIAALTVPYVLYGEGEFVVVPFVFVVAGYCVYQLFRPTPTVSRLKQPDTQRNESEHITDQP